MVNIFSTCLRTWPIARATETTQLPGLGRIALALSKSWIENVYPTLLYLYIAHIVLVIMQATAFSSKNSCALFEGIFTASYLQIIITWHCYILYRLCTTTSIKNIIFRDLFINKVIKFYCDMKPVCSLFRIGDWTDFCNFLTDLKNKE